MPPHIVRYPPIQCNTRERCDQLQIPAPPPAWRVPEGPDNLAAAPMGGGRAWPGFEATHNRASAAGVEGVGGSGGPGRASRSTTPSCRLACGDLAGGRTRRHLEHQQHHKQDHQPGSPPPTGTTSGPAPAHTQTHAYTPPSATKPPGPIGAGRQWR